MNATYTRQPGLRAIRAARALTPKREHIDPNSPPEDPRTRQAEIMRKAAIIDAEFVDLHDRLNERMACAECGGLFPHAELLPASAHPEAAPICRGCLNRLALEPYVQHLVGCNFLCCLQDRRNPETGELEVGPADCTCGLTKLKE